MYAYMACVCVSVTSLLEPQPLNTHYKTSSAPGI